MRNLLLAAFAAFAILFGPFATAQDTNLAGHKIAAAPVIDGTIDATEWAGVPMGQGAYDDDTGERAAENLQFWLAFDDSYIYFAARAFDPDPASIRATEYRTNVSLSGDDNVRLLLDLSGSLADFNEFGMNAKGATSIELAGGRAAKREWSGEFVAQGRITPDGWEVEARIPWRIMRLPAKGPRTIRFNVERSIMRTQRDQAWQYTGGGQFEHFGRWNEVVIPDAPPEHSLKLLPYFYGGYDQETGRVTNAGLDLKTNLADEISLVGSINPDFRNIENDILSLDFSRFERLAGETRPFFQEGSQYLSTALFASQRIRNFDAGLNVYGKLGDKMSFGVLDAIDLAERNSFVANFSYDPTPVDSFRVTATSLARTDANNDAYLLRYNRQVGPLSVFLRTMGSRDTSEGSGTSNSLFLEYSKEGLFGFFGYDTVSPNFLPRLGFIPERDYKGPTLGFEWTKPIKSGAIREVSANTFYSNYEHFDGGHYRESIDSEASVLLANNIGIGASLHLEDFEGIYDRLYGVAAEFPQGNPYRHFGVEYQWGRLDHEDYRNLSVGGAYRLTDKIQLTASYQHVDHFERDDLGIIGMNYDLGRDMYVSGRAVKRGSDWNAYLSFRRSGNRGLEYYFILGNPNATKFETSLIFKVVMPIEIR
jgi:hypothetical protein